MPRDQVEEVELLRAFGPSGGPLSAHNRIGEDVGAERLRVLADFLDTLPPEKFDIEEWSSSCQSAGCAVGWACKIPAFRAAGLRLVLAFRMIPRFGELTEWKAVQAFFELDFHDAKHLFSGLAYDNVYRTTAPEVAARIREHLASRAIAARKSALDPSRSL